MVLTVVGELNRRWPDHRILVASYAGVENLPWGLREIDGRTFHLLPNRKRMSHLLRVPLHAVLRHTWVGDLLVRRDVFLSAVAGADLVVDLSGFGLSDRRPWWRRLVYGFEILTARLFGRRFVIFTQALGPFDLLLTGLVARFLLPLSALIIARGNRTRQFLEQAGVASRTRVEVASDCAYLFPSGSSETGREILHSVDASDGPKIGVVPNINAFNQFKPHSGENPYILQLRALCRFIEFDLEATPILVCHEEHENRRDDMWLARLVGEGDCQEVPIVSARFTAAELKGVIGEMELLVASRFHSIVAAVSTHTPVVALGWAHKYQELMDEAGLGDHAMDVRTVTSRELLGCVRDAWRNRERIRRQLEVVAEELQMTARAAFDYLDDECPPR